MTDSIPLRGSSNPEGLRAAAQILRAAGPGAELVFAQLTPDEARAIHATMDDPSAHPTNEDRSALEAFLLETAGDPRSRPERPENSVWAKLTKAHAPILAALANRESPQVAAWMISRLDPHLAANVVRVLSDEVSLSILKRILNAKTPPKPVCDLIETTLETTLSRIGPELQVDGHATVARIFDQLDEDANLLAKLDQSTPGAADRVRALMFTFEDLVVLDAAGMQTLIAVVPRDTLVRALKGTPEDVSNAFYSNLTRRAGALIREEMDALGPLRSSDVREARANVLDLARQLIESGEINVDTPRDKDELVE